MEITVSPDQIWHHPLGTPIEECWSRLARPAGSPTSPPSGTDGAYDGMYVEVFGERWLATIVFANGRISRQTLLLTTTDRRSFKNIYKQVKKEFGRGIRQGLLHPRGYIWEYAAARLILTVKEAPPLTGIYLILTKKP